MSKVLQESSFKKVEAKALVECDDDGLEKENRVKGVDSIKVAPFDEGQEHFIEL